MRIVVFGIGYVGLSNAIMLARKHHVTAVDVVAEKVQLLNQKHCPIADSEIKDYLIYRNLNIQATTDGASASQEAELIIVATPTDFDDKTNSFDMSSVESVIKTVRTVNSDVPIVIRSTVPIGYVQSLHDRGEENVMFMPEFLREGKGLHDCLNPTRIIVGEKSDRARRIAEIFSECSEIPNAPILLTGSQEAEAIKLFANSYLALRVAFFNELDTLASEKGLDTKDIIEGVGLDPRIGLQYCNPSFGYGGYCLPKDTKQLVACFENIPSSLIEAIVESNKIRKDYIVKRILDKNAKVVGIYRLSMKKDAESFRAAAVVDIIDQLKAHGVTVIVYEPHLKSHEYRGCEVIHDWQAFQDRSDVIVANRKDPQLKNCEGKVFTRDVFCWG